ncbi:hypothetical protein ACJJTC_016932 [Scirpophaga incertulas]
MQHLVRQKFIVPQTDSTTSHLKGYARTHKSVRASLRARVFLYALLRLPLATVLLYMPLRLHQGTVMWTSVFGFLCLLTGAQLSMGKEEKAMFRAHSAACLQQSKVDPALVEAMLAGKLVEEPTLKAHVYCVLLRCKVVSKDGKLRKAAVLGKMANSNAAKILETCADQPGETPEEVAWNVFRCGYDKKTVLFEYMPSDILAGDSDEDDLTI